MDSCILNEHYIKQNTNKKIVILFSVLCAVITSAIAPNILADNLIDIDQENTHTVGIGYGALSTTNDIIAQDFTPTLNVLTHVELLLRRDVGAIDGDITVEIRNNLSNSVLSSASKPVINLTTGNAGYWYDFDFDDINTNLDCYFILIRLSEKQKNNSMVYWVADHWNTYDNGSFYISTDNGNSWVNYPEFDGQFISYG